MAKVHQLLSWVQCTLSSSTVSHLKFLLKRIVHPSSKSSWCGSLADREHLATRNVHLVIIPEGESNKTSGKYKLVLQAKTILSKKWRWFSSDHFVLLSAYSINICCLIRFSIIAWMSQHWRDMKHAARCMKVRKTERQLKDGNFSFMERWFYE